MSVAEVMTGQRRWWAEQGDCLEWLRSLPADSVSLVFSSPPYSQARLYLEDGQDLGVARDTEEWVAWMLEVVTECLRVCTGLCAFVVDDQTRDYRYGCGPQLLMADLCRRGICVRKPPIYRRVGIPGSGGPDWLRSDYEPIVCVTRGGPLPWSDNTACGHPPKWTPGGEMSYRVKDGSKRNQWGKHMNCRKSQRKKDGTYQDGGRPSHVPQIQNNEQPGLFGEEVPTPPPPVKRGATRGYVQGDTAQDGVYSPPVLANPGNVIARTYTAQEVADLLGEVQDIVDCKVGGGQMGSKLAHENEAPFPLELAEFFVRSFCPPDGIVLDPFVGSGTTLHAAVAWGRRGMGCDLRASQVDLTTRRLASVTLPLFS